MFRDRKKMPVFEQEKLSLILDRLGLLAKFNSGELTCFSCGDIVNSENFGAFFKNKGKIIITCTKPNCLNAIQRKIEK